MWYVSLIFTTQINPTCDTYVLQVLQEYSYGIPLIFLLEILRDLESFISLGKMSHIIGNGFSVIISLDLIIV